MINPKIFHYFKKALKWEIIIICASYAYIMPWHTAHAAAFSTWNGRYMMLPDTDRAAQLCADEGLSFYPASNLSCRTNGAYGDSSPRYVNGYRFHYQSQPVADRDIDDEDGNPLYEGGQPYAPPAPDILSCTRDSIPINIGLRDSPQYPSFSDIWTDIDGCQYSIDYSNPDDIVQDCGSYPDSDNPDEIWCDYNIEPVSTIPPPNESEIENPIPEQPTGTPSSQSTPAQEDTKHDLIVDWSSWEPNPPVQDNHVPPNDVVTITLPDGGTVDVTIAPDGKISIDYGDYSPNDVPIIVGPNGYPQPNPGYSRPGGGSPGGSGPSGGSPDGPSYPPGIGGGPGGDGGDGGDNGGADGSCGILPDVVCEFFSWVREPFQPPDDVEVPFEELDFDENYDSGIAVASCPAPISIVTQFGTVQFDWFNLCSLADMIRPLVIAFSYLVGIYILLRVK